MKLRDKLIALIDGIGCSQEYLSTLCGCCPTTIYNYLLCKNVSLEKIQAMEQGLISFKKIIKENSTISNATEQFQFLVLHGFKMSELAKRLPFSYRTIKRWFYEGVSMDGAPFVNEMFQDIVGEIFAIYE